MTWANSFLSRLLLCLTVFTTISFQAPACGPTADWFRDADEEGQQRVKAYHSVVDRLAFWQYYRPYIQGKLLLRDEQYGAAAVHYRRWATQLRRQGRGRILNGTALWALRGASLRLLVLEMTGNDPAMRRDGLAVCSALDGGGQAEAAKLAASIEGDLGKYLRFRVSQPRSATAAEALLAQFPEETPLRPLLLYTTIRYGEDPARVLEQATSFLKNHPEHYLADDVLGWQARTLLISGDKQQALDAYLGLLVRYPESDLVNATLESIRGIEISSHAFAFNDSGYQDFVLLRYILTNTQTTALSPVYAGLFADWDIAPFFSRGNLTTRNACAYDESRNLVYAYDRTGSDPTYYGMTLLSGQPFRAYAVSAPSSFSFNGAGKFQALSNIPTPATATAGLNGDGVDLMQFISGGVGTLLAGKSDTLVFALLAHSDLPALYETQAQAAIAYRCRILGEGPNLPFALSDTLIAPGQSLQLTDPNEQADSWSWDFGDGNGAITANPTHSYAAPGTYTLSLTVTQAGCTERYTQTLQVTGTNALEAGIAPPRVRLYPNPSTGLFTLETSAPGPLSLRLTDLRGRQLQTSQQVLHRQQTQLQVQGLPSGAYLLHIQGTGWQEVHTVYLLP